MVTICLSDIYTSIVSNKMKTSVLLFFSMAGFLLFCHPVCSQAQSSDRPRLTWEDFTPASADSIGMTSRLVVGVSQALVQDEDKHMRDLYIVEVDTVNSLYDPDKVTDWDLRFNQVLFDLAQLSMKQATEDNHNGKVGIYGIYAQYRLNYDESKELFLVNSAGGRDTAVIKDYENRMNEELANIGKEDFHSVPFSLTGSGLPFYVALMIGYENNCFLNGLSDNFRSFNGFNISAELHIKSRFRLEMQFSQLWSKVKTQGFYYDSDIDYYWKEETANDMVIRLGIGYDIVSREKISLTPFVGFQSVDITQDTGFKDIHRKKIKSTIPGGEGIYIGMDVELRPKGTYGLRLRLFGSHGTFAKNVDSWSLNTGIMFLFPEDF